MIHSQQLPLPSPEPKKPLLPPQPHPLLPPQPPHANNRRIIQMQLPPKPQLLLRELFEQPQFVAVKSLIFLPPRIIYALLYAGKHVNVSVFFPNFGLVFFAQYMDKRLELISTYSKI